jgi:hypothetical protein
MFLLNFKARLNVSIEIYLKNIINEFNEIIERNNIIKKTYGYSLIVEDNIDASTAHYYIDFLKRYTHQCFLDKYYTVEDSPYLHFYEKNNSINEILDSIFSILEMLMEDFCLCELNGQSSLIYSSQIKENIDEKTLFDLLFNYYYFIGEFDKGIDLTKKILNLCELKRTAFSPYDLSKQMIKVSVKAKKFTEVYGVIGSIDYEFFYEKYPFYTIKDIDITEDMSYVFLDFQKTIESLEESIKEKSDLNDKLRKKDKELEDMMSMFAHKFRSPLDAIIYNTNHENNPKLYIEAAQTMRGLLDIFSIISTDETILKNKIKADNQGSGTLIRVLSKTLNMILLHLLSASGSDKIQQHYLVYAKKHGKVDSLTTSKMWNEDFFELERSMQSEWESDFSELLSTSCSLQECLDWIENHFFKLELIGFERDDIQFKEYSVTESFLTILFNEIIVNTFKYYSSETKQSVVIELNERDENQVIICRNPSIKRERTTIKGSGKGHVFLSALASKIGSNFTKPKPQDNFVVEFAIPSELLISN